MPKAPVKKVDEPMFVTWKAGDEAGMMAAINSSSAALKKVQPVVRRAKGSDVFFNIGPNNTSVRDGYDRMDWDAFRGNEALPRNNRGIMHACMDAYNRVGIVKHVIDLMGDFASQGVDLVHPNERIQHFYREWFKKVNARDRSERFLNTLYRAGNVVVTRRTAKLPVKTEQEMRTKGADGPDIKVEEPQKLGYREIPWRYLIRNPLGIEVMSDELALFVGEDKFTFGVEIPRFILAKIKAPKTPLEVELVGKIPAEIRESVKRGERMVPLDKNKTRAFYYKRDDWEAWAKPMTHAILEDLQLLQKMKLADLSALDGAISCIRVWKLGNIEARILPSEQAINRLADMLCNNLGGGVMDLVWGPELELMETGTDVHQFLGSTKYEPCLTAIYAGLGIPPTMTGSSKDGGGFTNNFISLKTLVERLEYGRTVLRQFWEEEIRLVQETMGFRFPATLTFEHMNLSDESTRLQLLIALVDRDLISVESLQDEFGFLPKIEEIKIRKQEKRRENGMIPAKAGPFHNAEKDHDLKKVFAVQGTATPSQVGLDLDENKEGEKTLLQQKNDQQTKQIKLQQQGQEAQNDHQFRTEKLQLKHGVHPLQQQAQGPTGQSGQGRPSGKKDSQQRKQKVVKPRTSAQFIHTLAWAEDAQTKIANVLGPAVLKSLGKKSMRELTETESDNFERLKFHVLCQFNPDQEINKASVKKVIDADIPIPSQVNELYHLTVAKYVEQNAKKPSIDVTRRFAASAVAFWKGDYFAEDEQE